MEVSPSKYEYDLSGMKVGDWFLGCPECGFQLETNTAYSPICPICGRKMHVCTVTDKDIK